MGTCGCGGAGSARLPSALQLCEAVEDMLQSSRMRQARSRAQERPEENASPLQIQLEADSIWHYLAKEEVKALGIIVERWSKGKLDGFTARQQFQSQVLRGQSQQAVELQNASSAFLRAGLDGALAGIAMGSAVGLEGPSGSDGSEQAGAGGQSTMETHVHIPLGQTPSGSELVASGSASSQSRGPNAGGHQSGPGVFGALAGGIFGGLAAAVLGGARAGARTQNVFSAIDMIFLHSTFEDSFGMAMQELGLDGPVVLPGEVRVSFQQRAKGILEAAPRQQAANASWLDLVMLCLCAEVIRNLKGHGRAAAGSGTIETIPPSPTQRHDRSHAAESAAQGSDPRMDSDVSLQAAGLFNHPVIVASPDQPGRIDVLFGLDWPQTELFGQNGSDTGPSDDNPGSFRLDPDFLRDRVFVLLESLLGGGLSESSRFTGMTIEEMDLHCPIGQRQAADNDSCPICLEPCVAGEPVRCLPCKHEIHQECIEAWLATADTCPTCRFKIPRT
jgi:hypothetical protein